jgi:hypothetical protein
MKKNADVDVSIFDGVSIKLPSDKKISKSTASGTTLSIGEVKNASASYSLDIGSCVENETMRVVFSDKDKKLKIAPAFNYHVNVRRQVDVANHTSKSSSSSSSSSSASEKFDILEIPGGSRAYAPRKQPDNLKVRFTPPGATVPSSANSEEEKARISSIVQGLKDKKSSDKKGKSESSSSSSSPEKKDKKKKAEDKSEKSPKKKKKSEKQ